MTSATSTTSPASRPAEILPATDTATRSSRDLRDAALRRIGPARLLCDEHGALGVALPLYREALECLLIAYVRGDAGSISWDDAWVRFDALAGSDAARVREAREVFDTASPVVVDRWTAKEASVQREKIEHAVAWLLEHTGGLDAETLAARAKRRRLFAGAAIAVALCVGGFFGVKAALTLPNVALNKPVTASSLWRDSPPPANAVNGIFEPTYGVATDREASASVGVDLRQTFEVERVELFGRGDDWFDRGSALVLETSLDGVTYRPLARRTEPFYVDRPWVVRCERRPIRFVRVRTEGVGIVALTEIIVRARTNGGAQR